jgi:hypothetical protein
MPSTTKRKDSSAAKRAASVERVRSAFARHWVDAEGAERDPAPTACRGELPQALAALMVDDEVIVV